ncbi:hypothetical protein XENOCAPTIV_017963, partial [Xenoophorus captivus]
MFLTVEEVRGSARAVWARLACSLSLAVELQSPTIVIRNIPQMFKNTIRFGDPEDEDPVGVERMGQEDETIMLMEGDEDEPQGRRLDGDEDGVLDTPHSPDFEPEQSKDHIESEEDGEGGDEGYGGYRKPASDDDLEEGEVKDPSDRKIRPRPICRFFIKGNCTWGMNCRFIHPGVNDKGNYSLITKPDPFSPNGAPPGGPLPLIPNNPWVSESRYENDQEGGCCLSIRGLMAGIPCMWECVAAGKVEQIFRCCRLLR